MIYYEKGENSMKKHDKLLTYLVKIAENVKNCGEAFGNFDIEPGVDLEKFANRMKKYEHKGDDILHETIVELNKAFITPLEHEDILLLSDKMDEVVDGIEEIASFFYLYHFDERNEYISGFMTNIGLASTQIYEAVKLLANKEYKALRDHIIPIKTYEEKCDNIERSAIRHLFESTRRDTSMLIKLKDLYGKLEDTMDDCQEVAKALDMILMKNL